MSTTRKLSTLLAGLVLATGLTFATAGTAHAAQHCYGNEYGANVCYERVTVPANFSSWIELPFASQDVEIRYVGGDMWSGRWFWPRNDAAGYVGEIAPSGGRWPMPGGTAMALVGHTYHYGYNWSATTAPFEIGHGPSRIRAANGYLVLQTNDDYKFDNNGSFEVEVLIYRR